jgi:hypothetical protein
MGKTASAGIIHEKRIAPSPIIILWISTIKCQEVVRRSLVQIGK